MKGFGLKAIAVLLFILVVVQGCSKKDDSSPTEAKTNPPSLPKVEFKGPNTTSTDTYAQITKGYVSAFNGFSTIFTAYASVGATSSGNTWTWSATNGSLKVTFTATLQTDGSYSWKCHYDGTYSGKTYSNWAVWEGTTSADGKSGNWQIYDEDLPATKTLVAKYEWATNSSGTLTGTFWSYDNGALSDRLVVINNADGTGEVYSYSGTVLTFKSKWSANGTGQWWMYNSTTGSQTGSGSWT